MPESNVELRIDGIAAARCHIDFLHQAFIEGHWNLPHMCQFNRATYISQLEPGVDRRGVQQRRVKVRILLLVRKELSCRADAVLAGAESRSNKPPLVSHVPEVLKDYLAGLDMRVLWSACEVRAIDLVGFAIPPTGMKAAYIPGVKPEELRLEANPIDIFKLGGPQYMTEIAEPCHRLEVAQILLIPRPHERMKALLIVLIPVLEGKAL